MSFESVIYKVNLQGYVYTLESCVHKKEEGHLKADK